QQVVVKRDILFNEIQQDEPKIFEFPAAQASSREPTNVLKVELQRGGDEQQDESEGAADRDQQDEEPVHPEGEAVRIGPGRPRIIRTGKSGRPRKEFNVLNAMTKAEIPLPQSCTEALSSQQA
ncbi:hypothetical protein KR084_002353, partial [Drosophila pseudotakahashii]